MNKTIQRLEGLLNRPICRSLIAVLSEAAKHEGPEYSVPWAKRLKELSERLIMQVFRIRRNRRADDFIASVADEFLEGLSERLKHAVEVRLKEARAQRDDRSRQLDVDVLPPGEGTSL